MKVTITEKHLKKAIRQMPTARYIGRSCLVAQAAKEVYGKDFQACGCNWMFFTQGREVRLTEPVVSLVHQFDMARDEKEYARIKLPVTINLPNIPKVVR